MKKVFFFSILLLTSVNVLGVGDLREYLKEVKEQPKLERSWKNYAKLLWSAFKLDRLGSKYNKIIDRQIKLEELYPRKELLEKDPDVRRFEKERVEIEKEFEEKAQELTEMQKRLFGSFCLCNPEMIKVYNIQDFFIFTRHRKVRCDISSSYCVTCISREIKLFKQLAKKQMEDDGREEQ